jgi:hypothetical protein
MYGLKDMSNLVKQVNKYLKTKIKLNRLSLLILHKLSLILLIFKFLI